MVARPAIAAAPQDNEPPSPKPAIMLAYDKRETSGLTLPVVGTSRADVALKIEQEAKPKTLREYVQSLCDQRFGVGQFAALDQIIQRESGWSPTAHNASGAHGLGQALPSSKMAPYGSDYLTNGETQAIWLMDYIAGRYGTPANALYFWQKVAPTVDINGDGVADGQHWY